MSLTFTGPVPVPAHQTTPLRILITGASRGLGLEMVRQYGAAHKDNVIFAAVRDPNSKTTDKVKALAASNSNIHIVPLDIADEDSIRASVGHVSKLTDRLDLLINNAGVCGPDDSKDVLQATSAHIQDIFAINLGDHPSLSTAARVGG